MNIFLLFYKYLATWTIYKLYNPFVCCRTYGPLKEEYRLPPGGRSHRRTVSELPGGGGGVGGGQGHPFQASAPMRYGGRPDVLPGPSSDDVPDLGSVARDGMRVKRKDSVARMTWDGLSYVVTVSRALKYRF